jgi:hypothetical protein
VNGQSAAIHKAMVHTRILLAAGAINPAITAVKTHVNKSMNAWKNMTALLERPNTAYNPDRNTGYPGMRISTGVNWPRTKSP